MEIFFIIDAGELSPELVSKWGKGIRVVNLFNNDIHVAGYLSTIRKIHNSGLLEQIKNYDDYD